MWWRVPLRAGRILHRENKKLSARLRNARLRQPACLEDIDYSLTRGLTKAQVLELSTSRWVAQAHNVLVTGPTGMVDDFGLEPLGASERKELLEILEDRYGSGATVVTSQLEPKDWHAVIGEATLADAGARSS